MSDLCGVVDAKACFYAEIHNGGRLDEKTRDDNDRCGRCSSPRRGVDPPGSDDGTGNGDGRMGYDGRGIYAFELLVNKRTGQIFPEPGPNMMWNLKEGREGVRDARSERGTQAMCGTTSGTAVSSG